MGLFSFGKKKDKFEVPRPPSMHDLPSDFEIRRPKDLEFPSMGMTEESNIEAFEEPARESVERELGKRDNLSLGEPIFVKLDDYKGINDELSVAKVILNEGEDIFIRIIDFNELQDTEYKKWGSLVADIEKKILYVDNTLFGK